MAKAEEEEEEKAAVYDAQTGLNVPQVAVWLVFAVIFLDTIGATISTPALPYYAARFGCSAQEIGYLFGAWSLTSTCGAPALGRLADRFGRRFVLLLSLVGAGCAAIVQGFAPSYTVLLLARGFSGMWAAVGSTCQCYLADACSPAVLPTYLSRLSAVPGLAMIFGPGLGGGLSRFGLNVPIVVDGAVSLFGATLVFVYLPESNAWLEANAGARRKKKDEARPLLLATASPPPPPPPGLGTAPSWSPGLVVLCLSQLLNGITFGTLVSMLALALDAKFGFDALQVGYTFVCLALAMVVSAVWITPRVQANIGVFPTAVGGTAGTALALVVFGAAASRPVALGALAVSRVAQSARGAAFGTIVVEAYSTATNRGVVLGRVQMFLNAGRFVGPLLGGYVATHHGTAAAPWYLAAAAAAASSALLVLAQSMSTRKNDNTSLFFFKGRHHQNEGTTTSSKGDARSALRAIGFSDLKQQDVLLDDERGSPEEVRKLGEWLANLLSTRHYRWTTHPEPTKELIARLLPELSATSAAHVLDLDALVQHAAKLQGNFGHIDNRDPI